MARKFPKDFKWCVASASYQIEGGWNADGKGLSIWDTFCHRIPSPIENSATGDVACDSYHNIERDVRMIKELGVKFYRFSLCWPRLLPKGTPDFVNQSGVTYYSTLIDRLLEAGVEPLVTLYHWDLPQALQDRGGWINRQIVDWFADYARFCFETFGAKVKNWITLNEPWVLGNDAYGTGHHAPGLSGHAEWSGYLVAHHELLAHAHAYRIYDNEFRQTQNGRLSISLNTVWYEPASDKPEDQLAALRGLQFELGWFANAIFGTGDYPPLMKDAIAKKSAAEGRTTSRLPEFSSEEIELLKGSADFFCLNHYFSLLTRQATLEESKKLGWYHQLQDSGIKCWYKDDWQCYGGDSKTSWVRHTPWGLRKLLNFIKTEYNNPSVFITENGCPTLPDVGIQDKDRAKYYKAYIGAVLDAIGDGCNVEGFTAWTLMDNFEWALGYGLRFGLYQTDFDDPKRQTKPKLFAKYYAQVVKQNGIE